MKEVAGEIFGGEPFVCADIGGSIFKISDYILNNYEKRNGKKYTRKNVPKNIEDEYKKIMSGLLTVIKPYYGMLGFRDQNHS